jgi:hypothetical protein
VSYQRQKFFLNFFTKKPIKAKAVPTLISGNNVMSLNKLVAGQMAIALMLFFACSQSKFASDKHTPSPNSANQNPATNTSTDTTTQTASNPTATNTDTSAVIDTSTDTSSTSTVKPDDVVDGEEVINDCGRCVDRAIALAKECGFVASKSKTYNLGFYKIPPSRGLCDIHFMNNMSDRIEDHEGRDSKLGNQVALYCPCTCGWASTEPF